MEITFFSGWETLTATLPLAGKAQSMQRTKIWKVKQNDKNRKLNGTFENSKKSLNEIIVKMTYGDYLGIEL